MPSNLNTPIPSAEAIIQELQQQVSIHHANTSTGNTNFINLNSQPTPFDSISIEEEYEEEEYEEEEYEEEEYEVAIPVGLVSKQNKSMKEKLYVKDISKKTACRVIETDFELYKKLHFILTNSGKHRKEPIFKDNSNIIVGVVFNYYNKGTLVAFISKEHSKLLPPNNLPIGNNATSSTVEYSSDNSHKDIIDAFENTLNKNTFLKDLETNVCDWLFDCLSSSYFFGDNNGKLIAVDSSLLWNVYDLNNNLELKTDKEFKAIRSSVLTEDKYKVAVYSEKYIKNLQAFKAKRDIRVSYFKGITDKTGIDFIDNYYGLKSSSNLVLEGKKYSFGVELETDSGYVPHFAAKDLNIDCEFDGSLRRNKNEDPYGGEYVTGPLIGDNGVEHLKKICYTLNKYCTVNIKSGLHIHIGGYECTDDFNVYAYLLALQIQDEVFKMLPPSRVKNEYCRKLPHLKHNLKPNMSKVEYKIELDETYKNLFEMVSCGYRPNEKVNKKTQHPKGRRCGYDKSAIRYCWLNFVPSMFNIRGNDVYTLEFRNHSGTLSFRKTLNWLKICIAFVYFVENHKKEILQGNVCLSQIIKACFKKSNANILQYVNERVALFREAYSEDIVEYAEMEESSSDLTLKKIIKNEI